MFRVLSQQCALGTNPPYTEELIRTCRASTFTLMKAPFGGLIASSIALSSDPKAHFLVSARIQDCVCQPRRVGKAKLMAARDLNQPEQTQFLRQTGVPRIMVRQ